MANLPVLPIDLIVNVNVSPVPSGLDNRNINSVLLLTEETPSNLDDYRIYIESASVAADYGSNSKAAELANAIFSQPKNIRSGNGRLVIAPLLPTPPAIEVVSATNGDFTTTDISANVANIILVSDGDLAVSLNGNIIDLTNLNFTPATTLDDIVTILNKRSEMKDVFIYVSGTSIVFESKKTGTVSNVNLAAVGGGTGTDLSGVTYFNAAGGVSATGVNYDGETVVEAIDRLSTEVDFTPMFSTAHFEDAAITADAPGIQSRDKLFVYEFNSFEDTAGIITPLKDAQFTFTRSLIFNSAISESGKYLAGYVGGQFSQNFSGTDTASTPQLKSVTGLLQDPKMKVTEWQQALDAGADSYNSFGGGLGISSATANLPFDFVYQLLWVKFAIQIATFNVLKTTLTKVPQTEQGMNSLKDAIIEVLAQGVRNGSFAPGTWNSANTFGDPEIFHKNIKETGYYVFSEPITEQSQIDRENRIAPVFQVAYKSAGAIHYVVINVFAEQ